MIVYRLAKKEYVRDLTGTGGLFGSARWHEKGTRILYTAGSFSLAKLEVLANTKSIPKNYHLVLIEIPDDISHKELTISDLPSNWNSFPHPKELVTFTEQWIKENKFLVMRVPSVHSPFEWNYLINPLHAEANRLKIIEDNAHEFDPRLK
ncbi:RES family NAD+ phosphorylase [Adhaeribacter radiodurans]|uniref:RES family NAD+ phosphorylase n=1 Tax=Adhaeribacter radiodurans TaxID=2745197 RepID=A0A7L7L4X1_9BACT|nr:RES family NAD+ phosphorylase [Adhaeribacter radiodurans]QMU27846.1 RES family NAD+ phosphorylase [Adhaeribacter radiodurans]